MDYGNKKPKTAFYTILMQPGAMIKGFAWLLGFAYHGFYQEKQQ
jgi:hypothetical protein